MKINIRNSERVFIVGTTGSGKTELVKHFLSQMNRVLVIDPKFEFTLEGFKRARELPPFKREFKIIFRPRDEDDFELSELVARILKKKNALIYTDELATIVEQFPETLLKLAQVQREGRSRRVVNWVATQRPRRIPLIFKTEAENHFQFFLRDENDRAHMTGYMGRDAIEPIDLYNFWYVRSGMKIPALLHLDLERGIIFPVQNIISSEVPMK